ncbi:hypothetical protein ACFL5C_01765, partial [Candidatus Omnitrophota bacterium]
MNYLKKEHRKQDKRATGFSGWLRAAALVTLVAFTVNAVCQDYAYARTVTNPSVVNPTSNAAGNIKHLFSIEDFELPEYLGEIKDRHEASSPVVIHIQDAHCNYDAQHRIAEIIEYLNKEYGINTVNLEGGKGDYDLSVFTDIDDNSVREKVADYFVKEGIVNGAEYFAANNPDKIKLWGVENTGLYLKNLNAYRDSLKHKDEVEKHLKSLNHILTNLKRHIYSEELLELDAKYAEYKAETVEFKDYLTYLIQKAGQKQVDIKSFRNIALLRQALKQEANIDFKKANTERDMLIDRLQKILSEVELKELVVKTIEFKTKKITSKDFYAYLTHKARAIRLDLATYPELQKFIAYIDIYNTLDKSEVMNEIDALENRIKETLYQNDKQKELDLLSKNLTLMRNLFNVTLTKYDYKYYKRNKGSFDINNYTSFINKEASLYKITAKLGENISELDHYREQIAKFYGYSFKRDKAFLRNIKFSSANSNTTILVTGGFHTENLSMLFKENNISYISVMPSFENEDGYESSYFKLLSGGQNPVMEKLGSVLSFSLAIASILTDMGIDIHGKNNYRLLKFMVAIRETVEKEHVEGVIIQHDGKERVVDSEFNIIPKDELDRMPANKKQGFKAISATQIDSSVQLQDIGLAANVVIEGEQPTAKAVNKDLSWFNTFEWKLNASGSEILISCIPLSALLLGGLLFMPYSPLLTLLLGGSVTSPISVVQFYVAASATVALGLAIFYAGYVEIKNGALTFKSHVDKQLVHWGAAHMLLVCTMVVSMSFFLMPIGLLLFAGVIRGFSFKVQVINRLRLVPVLIERLR